MGLKKKLSFAVKGESFLEFKQEQLIFEIKNLWGAYKTQRKEFIKLFLKIMILLNKTYKEMGKNNFKMISSLSKIQFKPLIDVKHVKKIGNLIPSIDFKLIREEILPAYSFENTSHYLDDLIKMLIIFFERIVNLAEIEDTMLKHALSFKKITRRINGLNNIIIPELNLEIKKIKDILEEIQRENFVRLKNTKDLIYKKKLINT
jgi:V/A-type H+-transporting ATPase subunit D